MEPAVESPTQDPRAADRLPVPSGVVEPEYGPVALGENNDADVRFADQLVQLDTLLAQISQHTLGATEDGQVRTLAASLSSTSQQRIVTVGGWLQGWGGVVPARPVVPPDVEAPPATDGGEGVNAEKLPGITRDASGIPRAPGLLDDAAVQAIVQAEGAALDALFLDAVDQISTGMAQVASQEVAEGENDQATSLAGRVVAQQEQLAERLAELRAG